MSSTYLSLHYHLGFGTKNRIASIGLSWRSRLHEYMGGTVCGLGGFPEVIGGTADHVHLLLALKSPHCLADVVRELKKASSAWVHKEIAATVRDAVRKYISNQEEHHRFKSFREEFVEFLEKAGIEYDPRYLD